ncbi:hypothetical protein [Rahnella aceris]|uniref:hypothetical protein n=1 Tax=Rahnella sp. (strain Y9602) TaxID=2703885 RepID=UPI001F3A8D04|nr:hypothetical protein [Rahnella aceris]
MSKKEVAMINHLIINGVKFTLPESGRVLLQMTGGEIADAEILRDNQHVQSLQAFLEIAEFAGYKVIPPEND